MCLLACILRYFVNLGRDPTRSHCLPRGQAHENQVAVPADDENGIGSRKSLLEYMLFGNRGSYAATVLLNSMIFSFHFFS
jgi:hypothetical protein